MQKQVGGEGVNFASLVAGVAIVVVLGGWLAWATGVGGKPLPSIRANMTLTAASLPTLDATALMGEIKETPFYYGIIPVTSRPRSTATPPPDELIAATQTRWWQTGGLATVQPTSTPPYPLCQPSLDDACFRAWVDAGLNPQEWWDLWTPQIPTLTPTLRNFVTFTPSPQFTLLPSATARAAERTPERFSDGGVPQRGAETN